MKVHRGKREEMEKAAANTVARLIKYVHAEKGVVVCGLVGGSSVEGLYAQLIPYDLPWKDIHFFWADERLVPIESEESNYQVAYNAFVRKLIEEGKIPEHNIHPFNYEITRPIADQIATYTEKFKHVAHSIDIAILSGGEDGHVASLFPNHPSIHSTEPYFIQVENAPKPPADRISASPHLLASTNYTITVIFGDDKRTALDNVLNPYMSVEKCPVRLVSQSDEAYIYTNITH